MASESVATTPIEAAREVFGDHPEDVLGTIDIGGDRLSQLASLFKAIGGKAEKHSDIWQLPAGAGGGVPPGRGWSGLSAVGRPEMNRIQRQRAARPRTPYGGPGQPIIPFCYELSPELMYKAPGVWGDARVTAEVAVLNCFGVALAADSAVTVGSQKIYNSAVKLFALSKVAPVAVMVHGNAAISRVPWEVVIKEFRRTAGATTHPKLEDYVSSFIEFIKSSKLLFDANTEDLWLQERVAGVAHHVFNVGQEAVQAKISESDGAGLTAESAKNTYIEKLKEQLEWFKAQTDLRPSPTVLRRINPRIEDLTKEVGKRLYGDFYDAVATDLLDLAKQAVRRSAFPGQSSGIVIAGYGDHEVFPGVVTLDFDGALAGFVRCRRNPTKTFSVSPGNNGGAIVAYAQEDMVATFMEGINPSVKSYVENTLNEVFRRLPEEIAASLQVNDADAIAKLGNACDEIRSQIVKAAEQHRVNEHVMPVINMVMSLPKDELASMAEALVNLTAFKRRVTGALETVGGPIDVCVISKGDGLVWVKRKHYFPADLNLLFQQNYMRGLSYGAEEG